MRRAPLSCALLLVLLSSATCSRCGKSAAGRPERFIRGGAPGLVVLVPSLGSAGHQAGELARRLSDHPSTAPLAAAVLELKPQLGFDPLDPKDLSKAGLDPDGAAALFAAKTDRFLVLPVGDASRFDATVSRLARDRLGAATRKDVRVSGRKELVLFSAPGEKAPALGYVVIEGQALLGIGSGLEETLTAAAALPAEQSLAQNPAWKTARAAVGEGYAALAFAGPELTALGQQAVHEPAAPDSGSEAPPGPPAIRSGPGPQASKPEPPPAPAAHAPEGPLRDGAALGIRFSDQRLAARAAVLLSPGRQTYWREIAGSPAEARSAGIGELAKLEPGAPVAGRWGGDFAAIGPRLARNLPGDLAQALRQGGIDLQKELFGNLRPGAAFSLAISPDFKVTDFAEEGEPDLLRIASLVVRARVRDPAALRGLFEKAAPAAARMGRAIEPRTAQGGASAWTIRYTPLDPARPDAGNKLTCILDGDQLTVLAGRAGTALDRPGAPGGAGAAAHPALKNGIGAAAVDFDRLAASIRALPEEAFGTGPLSVVMSSMAEQVAQSASTLRTASLTFDLAEGAAILDLTLEAKAREQKAP